MKSVIRKQVIYMVTYIDDDHRKHITFVEGFNAVRFLENRFDSVWFERTENYARVETE